MKTFIACFNTYPDVKVRSGILGDGIIKYSDTDHDSPKSATKATYIDVLHTIAHFGLQLWPKKTIISQ